MLCVYLSIPMSYCVTFLLSVLQCGSLMDIWSASNSSLKVGMINDVDTDKVQYGPE